MMKKTGFLAAALAGLAMVMAPQMAMARSQPGELVIGHSPDDQACISTSYAAATNTCKTNANFQFPIVTDNQGATKTFTINAIGSSATSNVSCVAIGSPQNNVGYYTSGYFNLPSYGSPVNIVESVYAPASGTYLIACTVGPGASVNSINFTP